MEEYFCPDESAEVCVEEGRVNPVVRFLVDVKLCCLCCF